jgi:hypothetical protein
MAALLAVFVRNGEASTAIGNDDHLPLAYVSRPDVRRIHMPRTDGY